MSCEARMWDLITLHSCWKGQQELSLSCLSLCFEAWLEKVLSQQPGYQVLTKAKVRQFCRSLLPWVGFFGWGVV